MMLLMMMLLMMMWAFRTSPAAQCDPYTVKLWQMGNTVRSRKDLELEEGEGQGSLNDCSHSRRIVAEGVRGTGGSGAACEYDSLSCGDAERRTPYSATREQ